MSRPTAPCRRPSQASSEINGHRQLRSTSSPGRESVSRVGRNPGPALPAPVARPGHGRLTPTIPTPPMPWRPGWSPGRHGRASRRWASSPEASLLASALRRVSRANCPRTSSPSTVFTPHGEGRRRLDCRRSYAGVGEPPPRIMSRYRASSVTCHPARQLKDTSTAPTAVARATVAKAMRPQMLSAHFRTASPASHSTGPSQTRST